MESDDELLYMNEEQRARKVFYEYVKSLPQPSLIYPEPCYVHIPLCPEPCYVHIPSLPFSLP